MLLSVGPRPGQLSANQPVLLPQPHHGLPGRLAQRRLHLRQQDCAGREGGQHTGRGLNCVQSGKAGIELLSA